MLTLNLDALFTPELLRAYRESWALEPQDANSLAMKIIAMFQNPTSRKQAWLRTVALAIVGPEPDLHAWIEAFARGSFELRPNVQYGRTPGKGSPSRFILRQRELIDSLIDKDLPSEERELHRSAYMDAIRLIVASMLVRELRVGVAAKAAIGTGWPIMVAVNDHLSPADKKLLNHFGGEAAFHDHLAKVVSSSIQSWINEALGGAAPALGRSAAYTYRLPPGMNVHAALTYLDREDIAVDHYRSALSRELGVEIPTSALTASGRSKRDMAAEDAKVMRAMLVKEIQTLADRGDREDGWIHLEEARSENEPLSYSEEAVHRLRRDLPILSASEVNHDLIHYAAKRSERRWRLRSRSPSAQPDEAVQIEIERWVAEGLPPPSSLRTELAGYFEEDVCRRSLSWGVGWDGRWKLLGFGPPGALSEIGGFNLE